MYQDYAYYFGKIFPLKPAMVNFVLNKGKIGSLLDIGCGSGDLAIALSQHMSDVRGIDLDKMMIEVARSKSSMVKFEVMNMMEVVNGNYDTITCVGNTLVHLSSLDEIGIFFKNMWNCLVEGGCFILQIVNYDRILDQQITQLETIENEDIRFCRNYEFIDGKIRFSTQLITAQQTYQNHVMLYPLRKEDCISLLKQAGFTSIEVFGGFDGSPYSINTFPLVVVAYK